MRRFTKMLDRAVTPALTLALLLPVACSRKRDATAANFTAAMNEYLAKRGDLCVGKSEWPIDVTLRDTESGARDAVQMPVLESLGLVAGGPAVADVKTEDETVQVPVRRYQLTEMGKRYYLTRETGGLTRSGAKATVSDLCMAKLTLDRVVGWELGPGERQQALVTYTYRVDAPDWVRTSEARRVFPAVARVLDGQGSAPMKEGFTLTDEGWVANELAPASSLVAQTSSP